MSCDCFYSLLHIEHIWSNAFVGDTSALLTRSVLNDTIRLRSRFRDANSIVDIIEREARVVHLMGYRRSFHTFPAAALSAVELFMSNAMRRSVTAIVPDRCRAAGRQRPSFMTQRLR